MTTLLRIVASCGGVLILVSIGLSVAVGNAANVVGAVFYLVFPAVTLVILRSGRARPVAACFAVSSLLYGLQKCGDDLTTVGLAHAWPSAVVRTAVWTANWTWFPGLFLLVTVGLLRFPEGRLPGRGWRWVEATSLVAMAVWAVGISAAATSVPIRTLITAVEPLPAGGLARVLFIAGEPMFPVLVLCTVASLASLVVRHRRSGAVERAQTRWVLSAATVAVLIELSLTAHGFIVGSTPFWLENLGEGVGFGLIAVSTGIAISRYKLYEIDRIVSRTVTYAVVLLVLAALYVAALLGLAAVVPRHLGQLGVAGATLLVAALAVPLTRRVRRAVDHRFDRARFDADRVVAEFAASLRSRPDRGDVAADLVGVLHRTVAPAHAAVWVVGQAGSGTQGPTPPMRSTV